MRVLLLEGIHPVAAEAFRRAGFEVDVRAGSLGEDELVDEIPGVSLLGIRSNTKITPRVLEAGKDLLAVGCFCILGISERTPDHPRFTGCMTRGFFLLPSKLVCL